MQRSKFYFWLFSRVNEFQYELSSHGIGGSELISEPTNRQKSLRVTIRTVAEIAGVSTATVSNVMNNTGKASPATKRKVKAAIQSAKWEPNVHARNLARTQ
jgi:Bacterial regulatory proteins, lacI family